MKVDRRYRCAFRRFLNRPGFYAGASIRAEVEDTSRVHPEQLRYGRLPRMVLEISDCTNTCSLDFSIDGRAQQRNCRYKLKTLIDGLERFRDAVEAEIELYNERARKHDE